ncbi:hypothetical protein GCM10025869_26740 [Homoserinibacter gongjuensis]|uniref:Uncharacterized protein n=1 Tax=Homoserinibacter gongjuensis TaxID=1162968 RepID=A0ABQ6JV12_9MICO|nr:hypothetical protein GCM10025869_26740 [Homoserinibacter gongjuensis]
MRRDETAREAVDLGAVVVEVVLARDEAALRLHEPGQAVADRSPAGAADVDGAGGVRRDELEVDAHALVERAAAVALTELENARGQRARGRRVEADVEEARSGDLGARDAVDLGEGRRERIGEFPRRHAEALAELEGRVGRPVAVVPIAGAFEGDVLGSDGVGICAALGGRPAHVVEQDGGEFGGIHEVRS